MPPGSSLSRAGTAVLLVWLGASSVAGSGQTNPVVTPHPAPKPLRVITKITSFNFDQAPARAVTNQNGAVSRGGKDALTLCAPVQGASGTATPLFVWAGPGAANPKTLTVISAQDEVVYENEVSGTSFRYPADASPLEPGARYSWKVSGRSLSQVPPSVSFVIKLVPGPHTPPVDPLEAAQERMQHGLWYDAVGTLLEGLRREPKRQDLQQQLNVLYQQIAPPCVASDAKAT